MTDLGLWFLFISIALVSSNTSMNEVILILYIQRMVFSCKDNKKKVIAKLFCPKILIKASFCIFCVYSLISACMNSLSLSKP